MRDPELIHLFRSLESEIELAEPGPAFADDLYRLLRDQARRNRPAHALLLAVAALLVTGLVGGALVFGSGILPIPTPSESPTASADATSSQSPAPSAAPTPADASRWVWTGDPVNVWRGEGHSVTLLLDGRVLVAGGGNDGSKAEIYTPGTGSLTAGTWAATEDLGQKRDYHTATLLLDGRVLVAGGAESDVPLDSAEVYDPDTGRWSEVASMSAARYWATATRLADGRVLVAGGSMLVSLPDGSVEYVKLESAELFDPRTGRWSPTGPMPNAIGGGTATLLADGRVLVVADAPADPPVLFEPSSGTWTQTSPMSGAGSYGGAEATLLGDGRVLLAGGGFPLRSHTAIYDPTTDLWTETDPMFQGRMSFTATLLLDGRVLAAGSGDGGYGGTVTAELFDPETGTWTRTTDMLAPHGYHEGTRLADGRVLVVGGFGGGGTRASGPGQPSQNKSWAQVYEPGF